MAITERFQRTIEETPWDEFGDAGDRYFKIFVILFVAFAIIWFAPICWNIVTR